MMMIVLGVVMESSVDGVLVRVVSLFVLSVFGGVGVSFVRGFLDGRNDKVNGRPFNDEIEK